MREKQTRVKVGKKPYAFRTCATLLVVLLFLLFLSSSHQYDSNQIMIPELFI